MSPDMVFIVDDDDSFLAGGHGVTPTSVKLIACK